MSAELAQKRIAAVSPLLMARMAGALYLIIAIAAPFAEIFVRGRLVVYDDAAATAANILANEPLYRLAGVADLIAFMCDAGVALIFYQLLKPVSRSLSVFAASFRLLHTAIVAINTLNHFAPLVLLRYAHVLPAFTTAQFETLALVSLRLHGTGYNIGLVFFGVHCMATGYLIARSTFLPRILGALLAIAGLCYVTNSFANFLSPAVAAQLYPYILLPGLAEPLLALWLLARGLNVRRWKEQAEIQQPRWVG